MKITLTNHIRLTDLSPEIRQELMDSLSVPNPRWLENTRMGRWNRGVPRELHYYTKLRDGGLLAPRGYIRHLIRLCREKGIPHDLIDNRRTLPPVDFTFHGRLQPFQQQAADAMVSKDFGVLCAPTGSGKTIIALQMIARRRQPAMVVVHTRELADQWTARIRDFLGMEKEEIGLIGGGRKKPGRAVTVALVQSLYKCADDMAAQTGFLIVDESHRCPSRTFTEAVSAFDSRYMLGLSATPFRRDNLSQLIFWYLGDVHHTVNQARLVHDGRILQADVVFRETDFRSHFDPVAEYSRMLSELTADGPRNLLIAGDIAREAGQNAGVCLVLSDRRAHCENLKAVLKYRFKIDAELLTGAVPPDERKRIVHRLNSGEASVLIATGQLIGEGFDCPNLSTLFLSTPIKFSGRVIQYMGRVMRTAPGKNQARIYDYVDVHVDVLAASAAARRRIYEGRGTGL
ncbi:MAG: DEAD/DEAH box helicase [Thermodesulfobacteriota bacterium]